MNLHQLTNAELNRLAALANYHYDAHLRACPYCRQKPCTEAGRLLAALRPYEEEQEDRAMQASIEAEQAAERRGEQILFFGRVDF